MPEPPPFCLQFCTPFVIFFTSSTVYAPSHVVAPSLFVFIVAAVVVITAANIVGAAAIVVMVAALVVIVAVSVVMLAAMILMVTVRVVEAMVITVISAIHLWEVGRCLDFRLGNVVSEPLAKLRDVVILIQNNVQPDLPGQGGGLSPASRTANEVKGNTFLLILDFPNEPRQAARTDKGRTPQIRLNTKRTIPLP